MRTALFFGALLTLAFVLPQETRKYPATRTAAAVDDYHGTKISDPYRWLEEIDSPEVAEWVKGQNAVTTPALSKLAGRDAFNARITKLYDFPRTGAPFWQGGHWFYTKNSGLQ